MLEEEVGYHSDGDDVAALVDDLGHLLVLHPDHVLPVHLRGKEKEQKIQQNSERQKSDVSFLYSEV